MTGYKMQKAVTFPIKGNNAAEFIKRLKQEEGKDIWVVGGGELLRHFIANRLVDKWIIAIAPTILGKGIPLFHKNDFETRLKLTDIKRHNQFTELHYETV